MKFGMLLILAILIPSSAFAHESLLAHSHILGNVILNSSALDYLLAAVLIGGMTWFYRKKS